MDSYWVWRGKLIVLVFYHSDLNMDLDLSFQPRSKNCAFTVVVVSVCSPVLLEISVYTNTIKQYFVEILMAH